MLFQIDNFLSVEINNNELMTCILHVFRDLKISLLIIHFYFIEVLAYSGL